MDFPFFHVMAVSFCRVSISVLYCPLVSYLNKTFWYIDLFCIPGFVTSKSVRVGNVSVCISGFIASESVLITDFFNYISVKLFKCSGGYNLISHMSIYFVKVFFLNNRLYSLCNCCTQNMRVKNSISYVKTLLY